MSLNEDHVMGKGGMLIWEKNSFILSPIFPDDESKLCTKIIVLI